MKKIIITGAAGLVGLNLLSLIDRTKYNIVAIDKHKHNINLARKIFPEIKAIHADVNIGGCWEKEFENTHCVIQLQAQISSQNAKFYKRNNIDSVKVILDLCKKNKIKNLIHASSSVVISVSNDLYTRSKRAGEELVKNCAVPHTILRPTLMYGCFDKKHIGFITEMMEKFPLFFPVPGHGKYMRQPVYVNNFCQIIMKLIEMKPKNEVYNVVGHEKINFIDLLRIVAKKRKLFRIFLKLPAPVFLALLRVYSILTGKPPFVPQQLHALTAGDKFPVEPWAKIFNLEYVYFKNALDETYGSKYYKFRKVMERNTE
jgi:nucleoside-diphosphate-sugar epimerase